MKPSEVAHHETKPAVDWKTQARKWEYRAKQNREAYLTERSKNRILMKTINILLTKSGKHHDR